METSPAGFKKYNEAVLMTITPPSTIANPVKRTVIYSLVVVLTVLLPALLITLDVEWGPPGYVKRIIYATALLLVGTVHIFYFPKWLPQIYRKHSKAGLQYSILLAVVTGFSTFLLFVITGFEKKELAAIGACSFLLPTAILQSWIFFDSIFPKTHLPWFPPATPPAQKKAVILLNIFQLRIKIKMNEYDLAESSFIVTVPGSLQLGNIFHQFLMEQEKANSRIQLSSDQHLHPYAWTFLLQRQLGTRVLDPELTLTDNKIKQRDIILIERIKID